MASSMARSPLKDARSAFQHVLDRKNKGKVLLVP
jgi:hypothetical protein